MLSWLSLLATTLRLVVLIIWVLHWTHDWLFQLSCTLVVFVQLKHRGSLVVQCIIDFCISDQLLGFRPADNVHGHGPRVGPQVYSTSLVARNMGQWWDLFQDHWPQEEGHCPRGGQKEKDSQPQVQSWQDGQQPTSVLSGCSHRVYRGPYV